jgi:hypothetical protein
MTASRLRDATALVARRVTGPAPLTLLSLGALGLAASSALHCYLWQLAYRDVPTLGPLFLFQAAVAFVLTITALMVRRVGVAVVGALFLFSTIGGLVLASSVGLFGFTLHTLTIWAVLSLVAEAVGAIALLGAGALCLRAPNP